MSRADPDAGRDAAAVPASLEAGLRQYFRKRVPQQEVEDLVQDVLISLQARQGGGEIESMERYVFAVAGNLLSKRARQRGPLSVAVEERDARTDLTPEHILMHKERLRRARDAIETLPARTREVFLLHRFEEMTYPRIARGLGISVSAVEKHIILALRALRIAVERDA